MEKKKFGNFQVKRGHSSSTHRQDVDYRNRLPPRHDYKSNRKEVDTYQKSCSSQQWSSWQHGAGRNNQWWQQQGTLSATQQNWMSPPLLPPPTYSKYNPSWTTDWNAANLPGGQNYTNFDQETNRGGYQEFGNSFNQYRASSYDDGHNRFNSVGSRFHDGLESSAQLNKNFKANTSNAACSSAQSNAGNGSTLDAQPRTRVSPPGAVKVLSANDKVTSTVESNSVQRKKLGNEVHSVAGQRKRSQINDKNLCASKDKYHWSKPVADKSKSNTKTKTAEVEPIKDNHAKPAGATSDSLCSKKSGPGIPQTPTKRHDASANSAVNASDTRHSNQLNASNAQATKIQASIASGVPRSPRICVSSIISKSAACSSTGTSAINSNSSSSVSASSVHSVAAATAVASTSSRSLKIFSAPSSRKEKMQLEMLVRAHTRTQLTRSRLTAASQASATDSGHEHDDNTTSLIVVQSDDGESIAAAAGREATLSEEEAQEICDTNHDLIPNATDETDSEFATGMVTTVDQASGDTVSSQNRQMSTNSGKLDPFGSSTISECSGTGVASQDVSNTGSSSGVVDPDRVSLSRVLEISLDEEEIRCKIRETDDGIRSIESDISELVARLKSKTAFKNALLIEEQKLRTKRLNILQRLSDKASSQNDQPQLSQSPDMNKHSELSYSADTSYLGAGGSDNFSMIPSLIDNAGNVEASVQTRIICIAPRDDDDNDHDGLDLEGAVEENMTVDLANLIQPIDIVPDTADDHDDDRCQDDLLNTESRQTSVACLSDVNNGLMGIRSSIPSRTLVAIADDSGGSQCAVADSSSTTTLHRRKSAAATDSNICRNASKSSLLSNNRDLEDGGDINGDRIICVDSTANSPVIGNMAGAGSKKGRCKTKRAASACEDGMKKNGCAKEAKKRQRAVCPNDSCGEDDGGQQIIKQKKSSSTGAKKCSGTVPTSSDDNTTCVSATAAPIYSPLESARVPDQNPHTLVEDGGIVLPKCHTGSVQSIVLIDDSAVISGGIDGWLHKQAHHQGSLPVNEISRYISAVSGMVVSKAGLHGQVALYLVGVDNYLIILDIASGDTLHTRQLDSSFSSNCICEDGGIVYLGMGGEIAVIERICTRTFVRKPRFSYSKHEKVCALSTSHETARRLLCVAFSDSSISIFDAGSNSAICRLSVLAEPSVFLWVANGMVLSSSSSRHVLVHELVSDRLLKKLDMHFTLSAVFWDEKNMLLIAAVESSTTPGNKNTRTTTTKKTSSSSLLLWTCLKTSTQYWMSVYSTLSLGCSAYKITAIAARDNILCVGDDCGKLQSFTVDRTVHWKCQFESCGGQRFWFKEDLLQHITNSHLATCIERLTRKGRSMREKNRSESPASPITEPCNWSNCSFSHGVQNVKRHYSDHMACLQSCRTVM